MKPVAIRKSRPVAVRKQSGPQLQYDMQGRPSFVFGAGGGGRGGGGRSKRERLLGAAGGLVGVLGGALTPTRSLGGLLGGMYAGGAQGSAVAGGLGRRLTGRRRQAQLDAREGRKQAEAEERGRLREDYKSALRDARQRARTDDDKRWKELQDTEDYEGQYDFKPTKVRGVGMFGGDKAKRRFMREQDPGGKYDTPEAQAARATREKAEAYMQPENLQRLADQELMRQKIKLAAKAALETGERPYVSPMSQEFERRDAVEEMGPGAEQRAARVSAAREAGGPTSPAGQGAAILHPQNENVGEEDVTGPFADHRREGLEELPSQAKFREMSNELYPDARQELGIDPRPVQVTGARADPSRIDEETERALSGGPQSLVG